MESEETRLVGEETKKVTAKEKSKGAAIATSAGGFVAGAAVGAGVSAAAATPTVEATQPEEEVVVQDETEQQDAPDPEQVILANSEGIRVAHVEADNFADAFAQARAQVGPGGVFEYNGKLYGTYYENEWNEMSQQERADYQARVSEVAPSHHSAPVHDMASHTDQPAEVIPANAEMLDVEPVNNEVQVLGVETVQTEEGQIMNIALLENNGDHALMVDVDNDGYIEAFVHDDDGNGEISENEIHDISGEGIHMYDIMGAQEGQMLNAVDDSMPDYINDADSLMEI